MTETKPTKPKAPKKTLDDLLKDKSVIKGREALKSAEAKSKAFADSVRDEVMMRRKK